MLIKHGIDHVDKGLVRREETVSAGQQVALEHTFHSVFAEHLNNPTVGREFTAIRIFREVLSNPELFADFIDVLQLVRRILVRTKDTEAVDIQSHHVPEKSSQRAHVLSFYLPRLVNL